MAPLVIPIGLVIGLSLGALGGGGSILTVPALVYLLGQAPGTATTSSLLIVGMTSLIALGPHARAGRVRFGQGLAFGALGTGGAYAGSLLSSRVSPPVLLTAFAGLMLLVGVLMLVRSRRAAAAPAEDAHEDPILTRTPLTCDCSRLVRLAVTSTGAGLLTGFFGVGGGFVLVPALVLALSFPMPVAVGTSLLVIALNSSTALLARVTTVGANLDWPLIAAFTAAAVTGSLLGGRLASRLQPATLTRAFAILVLGVATYTAANSLPAL